MASICERKNQKGQTRYQVKIRLKGRPSLSATFDRKTDAKRWIQEVEPDIRRGRHLPTLEARKHTLGDLVERYVADVIPTKRSGHKKDRALLEWWQGELGVYFLADVTPALIAEARDRLSRGVTYRGRRRSPATVNRYLAALSHAFTIALREWGWAEENPVRKIRRLEESRGRIRLLSDEERTRLLKACHSSSELRLYPLVVVALSTGARQGELLGLSWKDIDFDRGVAILHKTKNRERRVLPLAGEAFRVLSDLSRVRRIDTDLVFAGAKSGRPRFPQKAWEKALQEAQIQDFRFHDLRHSAASYLAMSGATLAEIAEVLGHKTLAMVKRYSHLTEQHTSKVVARMNEQFLAVDS